jgi:hypothetical protein
VPRRPAVARGDHAMAFHALEEGVGDVK